MSFIPTNTFFSRRDRDRVGFSLNICEIDVLGFLEPVFFNWHSQIDTRSSFNNISQQSGIVLI